jgi:ABC-type multidrug transport system fused ATPase/permease subunit
MATLDATSQKTPHTSTFAMIRSLLTPAEHRSALAIFALMLVGMTLETAGIGLVIPAVALLIQPDIGASSPQLGPILERMGNPSREQLVTGGMAILVAIFIVKATFLAWMTWRQNRFAFGVQANLSNRLFTTYLRQPYTFLLQRNSAQLIRNAITEVNQFTANAILPAMVVLTETLVLIGVATLLLFIEPVGAVLVVLVMVATAWIFQHSTGPRIMRWGVARQYHEGMRIQHLQQGFGGAKDLKLLGRENEFLDRYHAHNLESARVGERQITVLQLPRLWLEPLAVIGLATLVLTMVVQGRDVESIGPALAVFAAAAFRLMPSVNRVLSALQALRYALPVIRLLHAELALGAPAAVRSQGKRSVFEREIRLSNITFTYPTASAPSLTNLSIVVRKGECVGLVGSSGAGKSTLADVILGLLTPGEGEVSVDGHDIQQRLRAWQDQIGYVPQTIYLTDDTLRRNVAFGLAEDQIGEAAVQRALRDAQLEAFVMGLPDGLDTVVGERGVRLSGGQRQRIGIARALYHDPALLMLDEATSALDTATERDVMEAVTALQGRKTIVIVAHRLSSVENCDRLYRLEHGSIAAEGTPEELFASQLAL